jgi:DNA-binding NarL/FixJ family response regulator
MTVEEAVGYALADDQEERHARPQRTPTPKEPPTSIQPDDALSRREGEVALLVAQGLTNRQIASELTISENTVANHVARILKKLKLPSRSQIAVWMTEKRLHETR